MPVLIAALGLLAFVMPLATDMYLPALPQMAGDLHADASGIQLTLTTFLIGMGLGQLILGPLSDRFGRRVPLLAGSVVCAAATALCALAPSLGWLVVLRFLQGFGGAAGVVIGRAVIADVATGEKAAKLFGIVMALNGLAPVIAPVAGGAVIEASGWRTVFWVLAAATVLALAAAAVAVPESLPLHQRRTGGAAATIRAVREVLADRSYLGYTLSFGFSLAVLFCYLAGASFLFQNILGLSIGETSAAFASTGIVGALATVAITKLVGRFTPTALLRAGLYAMLASSAALTVLALSHALTLAFALGLVYVALVGICLVTVNATALALDRVPQAAGAGSAVLGTGQGLLGAVAAPLVGLGGAHTAVPMFLGMTCSAALAFLPLRLTRSTPAPQFGP
ncbi:multidrug effflux MFS transporter [Streptomyces noursei]|uniref:multidrug effflux MFS transporter n=1 Tax=Streptomyces noursei TaxID=1971 RepID=UPI00081C56FD|nr:MFS transporter [Streptomyces noursei ATCC 11455]MCZ0992262.1 multidrug effflux MFS transporter [Streptomyces noursei]